MKKRIVRLCLIAFVAVITVSCTHTEKLPSTEVETVSPPKLLPFIITDVYLAYCGNDVQAAWLNYTARNEIRSYFGNQDGVVQNKFGTFPYELDVPPVIVKHNFRIGACEDSSFARALGVNFCDILYVEVGCGGKSHTYMLLPNSSVCWYPGTIEEATLFLCTSLKKIQVIPDDPAGRLHKNMNVGRLNFALSSIYCKESVIASAMARAQQIEATTNETKKSK